MFVHSGNGAIKQETIEILDDDDTAMDDGDVTMRPATYALGRYQQDALQTMDQTVAQGNIMDGAVTSAAYGDVTSSAMYKIVLPQFAGRSYDYDAQQRASYATNAHPQV